MRNLFLGLLLANLLLLAWTQWVSPVAEPRSVARLPELTRFRAAERGGAAVPQPRSVAGPDGSACVRIGPLPGSAAAGELARSLAARGVVATPFAREGQAWLGNWVQVGGFTSAEAAEAARLQLVAAGLADAYLMQEGGGPLVSLGVFRDRARADRVAALARQLGFAPVTTDRYRPAVEYWLRASVPPGSTLARDALPLPGPQILRVEPAACADTAPGEPLPTPAEAGEVPIPPEPGP